MDLLNESISLCQITSDHDEFCKSLKWEKHAAALALTLVVPANASKRQYPILNSCATSEILPTSHSKSTVSCVFIANQPPSTSIKSNHGESPMPELDKYILSTIGRRGGCHGRIRAWSIEDVDGACYLTYQMCENRWCERIGRQHRSNNIMWTIDLTHKRCWQSCHDPDCRGFRGSLVRLSDLPEDVCDEVDEFLFDRELVQLDISRVINKSQAENEDEFDDMEMDQALRDLDIPTIVSPDTKLPGPNYALAHGQQLKHNEEFSDAEVDNALRDLDMPTMISPDQKAFKG